jgi:hypothetical protein
MLSRFPLSKFHLLSVYLVLPFDLVYVVFCINNTHRVATNVLLPLLSELSVV